MPDPNLIDNERTKLLANALDRAATAIFTVGIVTPCVSWFFDLQGVRNALGELGLISFVAVSFFATAGLHLLGRSALGELRS
jgi:hypothetical protein